MAYIGRSMPRLEDPRLLRGDGRYTDDWTLPELCQQMVESMRSRGADARIVLYPGAYHYFDVEGQKLEVLDYVGNDNRPDGRGATVGYQPEAAAGAYREVELFFGQHLKR